MQWEELPGARSRPAEFPHVPLPEKAETIREFLSEFGSAAGLGEEDRCIVLGDGSTEVAYEMSFGDLLNLFPQFFSEPQGTYILAEDATWCFVYTFEEDMYFSRSPRADQNRNA